MFKPTTVATLANEHALVDLELMFRSLEAWNSPNYPTIYLYCDSVVQNTLSKLNYKGKLYTKITLNAYRGLNRGEMEIRRGTHFPTLFGDFTSEKISLMEWALKSLPPSQKANGVFFFDADIFFLGPLPSIPRTVTLALSPHYIRDYDSKRFGFYNAGFLWTNSLTHLSKWRDACTRSRFFEQAALEELEEGLNSSEIMLFDVNENYGWWRLWQGLADSSIQKEKWSINRQGVDTSYAGIYVEKKPLGSIHTHWCEKSDMATLQYNLFVYRFMKLLSKTNISIANLLRILDIHAPWLKTLSSTQK